MMWKDSYRLGVNRIDNQHIELFRMTDELVAAARGGAPITGLLQTGSGWR